MIDSIKRLPLTFEPVRLIAAMHQVADMVNWTRNGQIALTTSYAESDGTAHFTAHGAATRPSRVDGDIVSSDSDYPVFISEFRDTYFFKVWEDMMQAVEGGICRMRLMKLEHKGCLSFHEDFCVRYHIPIVTNPRAFFFMNESGQFPIPTDDIRLGALAAYHLPADGSVFKVDTTRDHTVYNGGKPERVHLVMSHG